MKKESNVQASATQGRAGQQLMRALEPRIMFDAAVMAVAVDAAEADVPASYAASNWQDLPVARETLSVAPALGATESREIVVIDTSLAGWQSLRDGVPDHTEIILIQPGSDGLQQLADALQGETDIDAIHVLSHGDVAEVRLGDTVLNSASAHSYSATLASIGQSLSNNGDIFLYGCYTAQGAEGRAFLGTLATLTGADIAASSDMTASAARAGNWQLEETAGEVTTTILAGSAWADYTGVLTSIPANVTINFNSSGFVESADHGSAVFTQGDFTITYSAANWFQDVDDGQGSSAGLFAGAFSGPETITIQTTSGNEFDFTSFYINVFGGGFASVEGFRDVGSTGTQTTGTGFDQTAGTYTVSLDSSFDNVDRVVITSNSSGFFDIVDSFVLNTANNPPAIANLNGDSVAWAGVGGTVVLDASTNASLTDTELQALNSTNGNWSGANLTVQRSTAVSADTFGFNLSGALFTVSGNNLQSSGQTFATYTNTGGILTVNFANGGAIPTTALVNDVARHINYQNDTPAGDATIRFTLNDGTVAGTVANVTVTSDSIYVTNTSDVSTIDASNGVGLREAVTIGAADVTGSQSIIFSSALASQTITLGSTLTLGESLTLNTDAASTVTITGSTLSLSTGTLSFANGSGDTATINSIVAGTGGLSASGAGTLILGSTSNNGGWSGAVSVTGGTLNTDTSSRLSSGTLTLDGATLAMTVSGAAGTTTTFANAVVLGAGGGTIDIGGGAGANIGLFSGLISGSGSLTKTAAAILQLNGNNNYTGATNLSAGTLIVNHANALGTTAGGTTVTSGASARIAGGLTVAEAFTISGTGRTVSSVAYGALHLISGSSTLSGSVTLAADANISAASGASLTLSAVLGGSAALNKTDTGSLVLSSTDNESEYAGGITVTAGTLSISNDDQLSSGTISLSGGTLAITGATTINNSINLTSSSTIDNSANATLSGVISGANTLTKAGASTLTLSNTNSYAATTVSAGTLSVASDGNLGSGSVALVNGTTLAITGATTIDNAITLAGSTTISSSAAATLSGGISGSGSLGKSGASTLTLSGANAAHSGAITINAGTLSIGGDSNLGSNSVTLAGGTTLAITTGGTIDNNLTLAGAATMQVAAATTWSGVIGGSNNLAKTGASTLTLSNTNTLSGTITVSAGTLAVTGTTSTTTVASGATLTGTGTVDGPVTVQSGGTLSPGSSPGTLTINGDLAMDSGSTLAVEINGTTAGTDYDQVIVNGTVDVSGATLSVTHGYVAGSGDAYNIIVNDAADAVTGSFSGLSEGSTLTAGGNSTVLTTSYIGATGNDFTLTAPINDTPVIGNLNGDSQAWAGVGNTLNLDASANATISDTELNALDDWAGASLIIQRAGTAVSADTFDFNTSGAPFTVNGSTIESGGTPFATFTNSGGVLTISFTSSGTTATTALVQELVQRITYRNDTPAGDATIRFTLSDGSASTTADVTVSTDSIYVTNTTDTATINLTNGVSFSEAIAIAAADATGSQTIVFDSSLAGQTVSTSSASSLGESVTVDLDSASGVILTGGTLSIGSGFGLTVSNGTSDTASIATTLSGAGNFIKAGAGKATLSGTNNFTGTTTVSGGTLAVSGDGNLGSAAVVLNSGTTLQVTGSTTIDNAFTLSGSASIQTDSVVTLSGLLSGGAVTLTKTGGSRLTLSNTGNEAAFTGAMTVTAGTLAPTSDNSLGAGVITLNGGALSSTSGSVAVSIDNLFVIGASGGTLAASTQTLTLTGDISGSGTLSKANSQQLTLSGNNTFTGGLTVAGTNGISIADGTNLGSGTVSLNGALFTVTGSGVTITNAIVLNLDSTVSNANAVTFSGGISGGSTLTKAGAGTLTLSGANSGAWSALVTDGTLAISAANNLGSGTLSLDGGALEITGSSFFTLSNNIDLTGAGTIIATGDASLNGDISGAGTLTKTGLALFTLGGNNTYTGATIISAGALVLDVDTALGSTAAGTTVSSGATLQLSEGVTTADALTLSGAGIGVGGAALYSAGNSTISGTVTLAADTSINISNSCTQTLSNVVSGGFGLTKLNLGTLILSNINTYTGATNVSGGTLSVTGSTVSATTVGSGGTLKGTGTVGGAVTVQSGGTLAPGVSGAGTLTLGNSLTIQSGGTLAVDIAGTTAGTGYDVVAVTGTVDVSSATISTTHSYTPGTGDTYTIITNNAVDAITGTFSGLSEGATLTAGGNSTVLTASYIGGTGNDFSLTAPVNPTVTSVTSAFGDGTFGVGDAVTIIVSFSEVVVVNTGTLQLILETGTTNQTLSYSGGSGGSNLIFTYIVQAGDTSLDLDYLSTAALNLNGDSVQSASFIDAVLTLPTPGTAGSLGANQNIVVDGVRPTASIVVADTALAAGETSTVTITFSEAVTGLTSSDFTVENGVLSGPITSDGGVTWTATLTPTVSTTDTGNLITLDNTGVVDAADNTGTGTTDSNNYAIDTLRPTASIVVADTALAAGETSLVTITFNEAVTGLAIGDFTVAEGVLSGLITGNGGVTWTATLTPTASITDTSNLITLDNTDVTDAAGNTGTGTTDSNNYAIDTLRPTASIVVADTALAAGETSLVTITFNEAVSGLALGDFTVAQGVLSGLITGDGGVTWTATLTPTASIADTSNLITLDNTGVADAAGNTGTGTTDSNNYAIDTLRPTASIVVADTALALGETSLVTITFNEAVSGLALGDFTVAQGVLSGLITGDGGVTWTATLTPTASITDTSNLITLDNTGILDAAGNTGTGTTGSNNYAIDSLRPTAAIVVADTALAAGETSLVTITFNEAVSGLALDDFTVAQGVLSGLITGDGGVTWTATLTPTVSTTDTSNLITLNNTGVIDAAGNAGTGTTDSNNYAIDTLRPSATILVADTALAAGEISLVTITMSEAVANFDNADLSLANGTLSTAVTADGGITWTATFTPNVDITDTTNVVTFASTGVIDAAGNIGAGPIDSNNFAIDTLRPSATIVVADTALAEGETSLVTITFNEAVTGFTNADLSIANGTLSTVSSADGGITWTATFTPTTSINDTTNLITLTNSGMQDAAGNAGAGTTDSNNYAIDTLGPVVDIALSDYALAAGETATVTFTFSEAVSGFTNTDLTISNGTLSAVSSSDGGVTWTATFTPTIDLEDATNVIGINNTGYTDVAGNTGTGTTGSINFTIDTLRPTATILVAESALAIGQTSLVTITLSEAVANFDNADLSAVNGTLSTAVTSDGGITWTAVFTPDADISDTTNVVTFDSTGVIDGGGNTGAGTIDSNSYSIDTLRPTATIVVADAALAAGETSLVTITFNEVVSGFSNADLTIANGTLSAVSSSDGGLTWTATFTPTASITDTTNLISLDKTGIMDAVGNSGTGVTDSNNYSIDSLAPTASIVVADSAINSGETSLVTITFSEAVTGLTNADLTVANGTLSAPISADGGITWTATLTPNGNIVDSANLITLNNTGIQDLAGNSGAGTTDSNNFLIDTDIPFVVSLGLPENDAYVAGQNLDFTVNLSEAALVDTSGGTPRIAIVLETGGTIYASYLSGSGTSALSFRATVSSGQLDINGISLGSSIDMNGGSIRDTVGNNALAPLTSVVTTDILVDAVISTIASVNTPVGVQYNAGDVLSFTLNTSENVLVNTAGGTPGLGLDIGGVTAYASYVAGSGSNTLVFQYTVQAGDTDANGIGVTTLSHNGATLQDAAGNAMDLTLNSVGNTSGVILDTTAPLVTSVQLQGSPSSYAQAINFVISFNEAIEHLDISDLSLSTTGNASASISGLQQLNGNNWLVQVHGIKGAGDIRLDVKGTTDITDAASNPLANGFTAGASFTAQLLPAAQPVKPHTSIAPTNPVSPVSTLTIAPPIIVATTTFEVGGATNNVLTTVANISAHSMFAATSVPGFDVSPIGTDPIGSTYITSSNGRGHFDGTPGRNLRDSTTSPLLQRLSPVVATDHSGLSDLNTVILEPGVPLYIPLPSSMFNAADPDRQLSVEVRMKNGKPLVSWLQFDPVKGVLTGQAPNGFDEKLQLQIIVHDNKGKSSFGEMELHFDSKAGAIQNVPEKAIQPKGKPGAEVMGKPALTDQFARYGHSAKTLEADALLTALTQVSTLSTTRI